MQIVAQEYKDAIGRKARASIIRLKSICPKRIRTKFVEVVELTDKGRAEIHQDLP